MQELAEMVVKYGIPLVISILFIWGAFDLYVTLKKNWVPDFLKSFQRIADSSEDTVTEIKHIGETLHAHATKLDNIEIKIDAALAKVA